MNKGWSLVLSIGSVILLAVLIKLFSFSTTPPKNEGEAENKNTVPSEEKSYREVIRENYKVYSVPHPDKIDFAGEEVPLENLDVKERLDKELTVNTYWHSQTFLFHKRANRWFPIMERILEEEGVPDDFKYLALIESGLENVVSPAGARGFWQFMPSTAKSYGLEVNNYVDERYNVELATKAACQYLKAAYNDYGSWTLAAASYNMGRAGVANRLEEQQAENYFDLYLNDETSRYVFRIIAAKHILTHSEDFGFRIRRSDLYDPYDTRTVKVDTTINDLVGFSKSQGANYKILKMLNPWLRSDRLPNISGKEYVLQFPTETSSLQPVVQ